MRVFLDASMPALTIDENPRGKSAHDCHQPYFFALPGRKGPFVFNAYQSRLAGQPGVPL
jgi:hypothetical protein